MVILRCGIWVGIQMEKLQGIVGEIVGILAALGGAYFFVGFVANLVQSQISTVTGDSIGRAREIQQGIGMVMLLCVAVSVGPLTSGLVRNFYGSGFSSPNVLTISIKALCCLIILSIMDKPSPVPFVQDLVE